MSKQILKFRLNPGEVTRVPQGKVVLIAEQERSGIPAVWIEVEQEAARIDEVSSRREQTMPGPQLLQAIGTGHSIHSRVEHVGSAVCSDFVWHVYRVG